MTDHTAAEHLSENFSFASSIKDDVWHLKSTSHGYEWWYFDALSDDGRDAIVIIFLDNFIFSPRYNKAVQRSGIRGQNQSADIQDSEPPISNHDLEDEQSEIPNPKSQIENVPALTFVYYRNGRPLYRAINEFAPGDFSADANSPQCKIGESSFKFDSAPYGSGYSLHIKADLSRRRRLEANLEWLSIESDLLPAKSFDHSPGKHNWNLVAPRSDVTGSIKISGANEKLTDVRHFRGTGYHDHNWDTRRLSSAVKNWQWGRAHFDDYTAVYYRYCEYDCDQPLTKLFLVKDNKLEVFDARYEERKMRRNIFGVKFPREITLTAGGIELNIRQIKPIDESFFYLRFLSEAALKSADGKIHEAYAVTEHLAPKTLKYRWLDWLVNMRIGRNGKSAFLK